MGTIHKINPILFRIIGILFATISIFLTLSTLHAAISPSVPAPWLRVADDIQQLSASHNGFFLAYTSKAKGALKVIDTKTKEVFKVSDYYVKNGFFWSPGGYRLFFREQFEKENGQVITHLKAFDAVLKKIVDVKTFKSRTGFLTFNPLNQMLHLAYEQGIASQKLLFPGVRLTKWQKAMQNRQGNWAVSHKGFFWLNPVTQKTIQKKLPSNYTLQAFSVSPRGNMLAWQRSDNKIFINYDSQKSIFIGDGLDPSWHPEKDLLLYSGVKKFGDKIRDYDLKVYSAIENKSKYITNTPHIPERSGTWDVKNNHVYFRVDNSSDIYVMKLKI